MTRSFHIAPSIRFADCTRLGEEIRQVVLAGADLIHFDVMDNDYVPNLSFGPSVCAAMRRICHVPIDVHLMVRRVDRAVTQFARAGADSITFHPAASAEPLRTCALIREHGCTVGIALDPSEPVSVLEGLLDHVDRVLILSVNPGCGGQAFIAQSLARLRGARTRIARCAREVDLQIEGGITLENIGEAAAAGALTFVAGSAIFGHGDYAGRIAGMRRAIHAAITGPLPMQRSEAALA